MAKLDLTKPYSTDFQNPRVKPVGDVEIDWKNSLSKGIIAAAIPSRLTFTNFIGQVSTTSDNRTASIPEPKAGIYGKGLSFIGANYASILTDSSVVGDHDNYTVVLVRTLNDTTLRASSGWGVIQTSDANRFSCHMPFADGNVYFDFGGSGGDNRVVFGGYTKVKDQLEVWAFTAGTKGVSIWLNGDKLASHTNSVTRAAASTDDFWLNSGSDTSGDSQTIYASYLYKTALNDGEIRSLSRSAYQILKPKVQPVYYTAGVVSGNFTLTAESGGYAYTGTAGSLLLSAILGADTAQYTYSGTSVDLTFAGAGSFTINAETAQYTYSGANTGLLLAANLDTETAQYTYSGTNAVLTKNFSITGETAQYTYSGTDTAMQLGAVMVAESTQYTYSGSNISFQVSGRVVIGVTMHPNLDNRNMFIT